MRRQVHAVIRERRIGKVGGLHGYFCHGFCQHTALTVKLIDFTFSIVQLINVTVSRMFPQSIKIQDIGILNGYIGVLHSLVD